MKKAILFLNNFLLAGAVYAQTQNQIKIEGPTGWSTAHGATVPGIVNAFIKLILMVAAIIAFVFLVIGGIKWVMSGGDKEAAATAQKTITSAILGLVIVFAAWAIMRLIEYFFGIELITSFTIPKAI